MGQQGIKDSRSKVGRNFVIVLLALILLIGVIAFYQVTKERDIVLGKCIALATDNPGYCAPYPADTCSNINTSQSCTKNHECCLIDECTSSVAFSKAMKTSNPSSCDEMSESDPDYKTLCNAVTKADISSCSKITNLTDKVICEATITKDASRCSTLKGIYEPNSPGDSAEITCLDGVYGNFAEMTGDVSYCKKIRDLTSVKGPHNQHNFSETYYSYLKCMADITHDLKYCSGGALCFGGRENTVKCLYNIIDKRIEKEHRTVEQNIRESWGFNKTEWDYYKKELKYNKPLWEEYKQTHNSPPWWMFW